MENIQLEGMALEQHDEKNIDIAPMLLERWAKREGYIPSEADWIALFIKHPELRNLYADTSTLNATREDEIKVIFSYDNSGSHKLIEPARTAWSWINSNEDLVDYGVNLDIDGRWGKLEGSGVYTRKREEWFERGEEGNLIGLNCNMKEEYARRCPIILTKFGHPEYVDKEFWRVKGERNKSIDEIHFLIHDTFGLGKSEHGYDTMMGQYLPDESKRGVLKVGVSSGIVDGAWSSARENLSSGSGRFVFVRVSEDNMLTTDQIYSAIEKYVAPGNEKEVRKALNEFIGFEVKEGQGAKPKIEGSKIEEVCTCLPKRTSMCHMHGYSDLLSKLK